VGQVTGRVVFALAGWLGQGVKPVLDSSSKCNFAGRKRRQAEVG